MKKQQKKKTKYYHLCLKENPELTRLPNKESERAGEKKKKKKKTV